MSGQTLLHLRRFCYIGGVMQNPHADLDAIRSFCGIFKRQRGEKSATQELIEDRAEDLRLEEAKWNRFEKKLHRSGGRH